MTSDLIGHRPAGDHEHLVLERVVERRLAAGYPGWLKPLLVIPLVGAYRCLGTLEQPEIGIISEQPVRGRPVISRRSPSATCCEINLPAVAKVQPRRPLTSLTVTIGCSKMYRNDEAEQPGPLERRTDPANDVRRPRPCQRTWFAAKALPPTSVPGQTRDTPQRGDRACLRA